jgi:hypothetical protein
MCRGVAAWSPDDFGSERGILRVNPTSGRGDMQASMAGIPRFLPRFCAFSEASLGQFNAIFASEASFSGNAVFNLLKLVLF